MKANRLSRLWSRWRLDERGVAAVEFALILPILLALYLGGYEISQAAATYRKVADTTVELANVTTQFTQVTPGNIDTVMAASAQIMSPYSTTNLTIVLSEITTDAGNNATVTWSRAYNGATALTPGANVTMPAGLATANSNYIQVQTHYLYVPVIGSTYVGSMPMSDQIYMIPRASPSIPCAAC
ncbi:MAG: TadE/TadG family type IV pilus assembly protein [Caulobacterales bacterium]